MQILASPIKVISDNLISSISESQNQAINELKSLYSTSIEELFEKLESSKPLYKQSIKTSLSEIEQNDNTTLKVRLENNSIIKLISNAISATSTKNYEIESKIKIPHNSLTELFQSYTELTSHLSNNLNLTHNSNSPVNRELNNFNNLSANISRKFTKLNYRPVEYLKFKNKESVSESKILKILGRMYKLAKVAFKHQSSKS